MPVLTPVEFVNFMNDLRKLKTPVGSLSYEMSGGKFTRLATPTGRDNSMDYTTVRAETLNKQDGELSPN